ncbi:secreted protein [Rhizobium laguerreae]|uniref:Secreted protein n=1 Tax=Rhizobium laguerreae TaxID=1076926 RepID=A0AAX2QL46_9HYPH|nr:secreted protein [Rhizobium laguerreae]
MVFNRREFLKTAATASAALALPSLGSRAFAADAIKVGALYSQTGGLSVAEKLLANGVRWPWPKSTRPAAFSVAPSR